MAPTAPPTPVSVILTKRNGEREHTQKEIEWWINEYVKDGGVVKDYHMAAWLMAVCLKGCSGQETSHLTQAMVHSGRTLTWNNTSLPQVDDKVRLVDKHSTGGVGDKISLVLAPLVVAAAACDGNLNIKVPMMAGRGLGHTGGTIDKLESIPGFQTQLSVEQFQKNVASTTGVGCAICAATPEMCPADRQLYALRDVTGTVASVALQTSSILSKKIAERPHSLVLDVKYGRGSFQASRREAETLATSMIGTAERCGLVPTTAFLTRMDHPIGRAVGNWLEVKECIDLMKTCNSGDDPQLLTLILVQAAQMLRQGQTTTTTTASSLLSFEECFQLAVDAWQSGRAWNKFREMVEAQGGSLECIDNPDAYPSAKYTSEVLSPRDGYIVDVDALVVGQVSVVLGAGRRVAGEAVDATAGLWFERQVGDAVQKGDVICRLYTERQETLEPAICQLLESGAIVVKPAPVVVPPIVSHIVTSERGVEEFIAPALP